MTVVLMVAAACVSISAAHITARDLARAVPGFTAADPAEVLAWTPVPGVPRIFHVAELTQIIGRLDPSAIVPQQDVCFVRPTSPLLEKDAVEAMHFTLGQDSNIEVLEISHFPVPEGDVVFPRESLSASTGTSPVALWRGFVRYDGDKKFPVWARVNIRAVLTRIIASETLLEGKPIQLSQVRVERAEDSLSSRSAPTMIDKVAGYIPRRTIQANSRIWTDSIEPPKEIVKGDHVTVTVHSGLAVLTFAVDALTSGRRGDFISFKNPESGKMFRARIEGPKAASMQVEAVRP
jgi:flagella basal body P-ring formation protein FlgA